MRVADAPQSAGALDQGTRDGPVVERTGFEEEYPQQLKNLEKEARPEASVGLALSGGGIRSATFCLGFLQSLAKHGVLGKIDFMSTVSGGGYIGGFLGALFCRWKDRKKVEEALGDPRSFPVQWLRENGRYLAPNGSGDLMVALAFLIRNWLSVLLVMAVFALMPFLLINSARAYVWSAQGQESWFSQNFPLPTGGEFWWSSPLLALVWVPMYLAAAIGWAYWLIPTSTRPFSRRRVRECINNWINRPRVVSRWLRSRDRYVFWRWAKDVTARPDVRHSATAALALAALYKRSSWESGLTEPVRWLLLGLCALPLLAFLFYWMLWAWPQMRSTWLSIDETTTRLKWRRLSCEEGRLWERRQLTKWVSLLLVCSVAVMAAWLVDSVGQSLYLSFQEHGVSLTIKALMAGMGASAVLSLGPKLIGLLPKKWTEKVSNLPLTAMAWVASAGCLLLLLVAVNVLAHAISWQWANPAKPRLEMSWKVSLIGLGIAGVLVLVTGRARVFLHTSSLQMLYGFRLARAYLGTSNKNRANVPRNSGITDMIPGDDIAMRDYQPQINEGPIHIINLTFNETCSAKSNIEQRDRKGLQFAVSPFGLSVSRNHHALWQREPKKGDYADIVPVRGWLLSGGELRDPLAFGQKLVSPPKSSAEDEAITKYVVEERLGPAVMDKLRGYVGRKQPVPEEIRGLLVTGLNGIINGESICYDDLKDRVKRKATLKVHGAVKRLLKARWDRSAERRRLLNRLFLQAAYPEELSLDFMMFPPACPKQRKRRVEDISLGHWLAVSGAAIGTGLGFRTSAGLSLLAGLANIRLGYWWDSGVNPGERPREFRTSEGMSKFEHVFARVLPVYAYLLDEWLARFHGPARRYWQLSDGGHFENTAVYELIRRRLPRIICCDCGEDPEFHFADVANLVRKARTDFQAEITFPTRGELQGLQEQLDIPADAWGTLATLEEFWKAQGQKTDGSQQPGHALIARVEYQEPPGASSLILFVKPGLTGDEPLDLREYHQTHSSFPHESTGDQFFNEAQWESYRKLGEHSGDCVFEADPCWFTEMPAEGREEAPEFRGRKRGKAPAMAGEKVGK